MTAPSDDPLFAFRFRLFFTDTPLSGSSGDGIGDLCAGAFSECSGLEATMEPKVIKAGGKNDGAFQRVGPVTHATVVLKRGITTDGKVFDWFRRVTTGGQRGYRASVRVVLYDAHGDAKLTWTLENALPIKFKAADFNARGSEIGIEELHLAHEGLSFATGGDPIA